jgi:hypothetical protein
MVAAKKGLTPDMVVAVSGRFARVLSVPTTAGDPANPLAAVGMVDPRPELMRFDRTSAELRAKTHLRKVYLKLADDEDSLGLVSARTESIGGGSAVASALGA